MLKRKEGYSYEFKKKIVLLIDEEHKGYSVVVKEYDLNEATVSRWLKEYRTKGLEGLKELTLGRKNTKIYKSKALENLEKKTNRDLEEEIAKLKMEKEYYKRLAEVFQKDVKKKNKIG